MAPTLLDTSPKLSSSFIPPPSRFRGVISPDPASEFVAEPDRYALYIHLGCPWAHRTNIVYQLKRLQPLVALSIVSIHRDGSNGWTYDGTSGSDVADPIEGVKNFEELYEKADPDYEDGYSVPLIWDRKKKIIVNNDSVEIMQMLSIAFDEFLASELREVNKPGGGLLPENLRKEIDELGNAIERDINWGTYMCGMAQSQADYDQAMQRLLGDHFTDPDIRLFTTAVRFNMAYYTIFNCDWKQIRYDYPNLHRWLRALYYESDKEAKGAFQSTTHFEIFMEGYAISAMRLKLVPWGPAVPIIPLEE